MNDDSKVTAKIENTLSSHVPTPKKVGICNDLISLLIVNLIFFFSFILK